MISGSKNHISFDIGNYSFGIFILPIFGLNVSWWGNRGTQYMRIFIIGCIRLSLHYCKTGHRNHPTGVSGPIG